MKNTSRLTTLFLSLLIILSISCGKYKDGPGFSLRSKKARLTGEWKLEEADGVNVSGYTVIWEFEKNGSWKESYSEDGYSSVDKGEWEWENKKEEIELSYDDPSYESWDIEINRLTNKELWVEDEDGEEFKFEKE